MSNISKLTISMKEALEDAKVESQANEKGLKVLRESLNLILRKDDNVSSKELGELFRLTMQYVAYCIDKNCNVISNESSIKVWKSKGYLTEKAFTVGSTILTDDFWDELGVDIKQSVALKHYNKGVTDLNVMMDVIAYLLYNILLSFEILSINKLADETQLYNLNRVSYAILCYLGIESEIFKSSMQNNDWSCSRIDGFTALMVEHIGALDYEMPLGNICSNLTTLIYMYVKETKDYGVLKNLLEVSPTNLDNYANYDYLAPSGRMYFIKLVSIWWLNKACSTNIIELNQEYVKGEGAFLFSDVIENTISNHVFKMQPHINTFLDEDVTKFDKYIMALNINNYKLIEINNESFVSYMKRMGYNELYLYMTYAPIFETTGSNRCIKYANLEFIICEIVGWRFVREKIRNRGIKHGYLSISSMIEEDNQVIYNMLKEVTEGITDVIEYNRADSLITYMEMSETWSTSSYIDRIKFKELNFKLVYNSCCDLLDWLETKDINTLKVNTFVDFFSFNFMLALKEWVKLYQIKFKSMPCVFVEQRGKKVRIDVFNKIVELQKKVQSIIDEFEDSCDMLPYSIVYLRKKEGKEVSERVQSYLDMQEYVISKYSNDSYRAAVEHMRINFLRGLKPYVDLKKVKCRVEEINEEFSEFRNTTKVQISELNKEIKDKKKELKVLQSQNSSNEKKMSELQKKCMSFSVEEKSIQQVKKENSALSKQIEELKRQLERCNKQIEQNKNKLDTYREKLSLLNIADVEEEDVKVEETVSYEEKVKALKGKKVLFLTGLSSLMQLKEDLGFTVVICPKQGNVNSLLKDIDSFDMIVFETGHIGHSTVEYVGSLNKGKNKPIIYIDKTNAQKICEHVYEIGRQKGVL